IMPQMGESIQEGTLVKWLKRVGESVGRDEPLFEISTDKVDAEIPSPAAGVLAEVKTKEGATVAIKTVVAVIETEAGAAASAGGGAAAVKPAAVETPAAPAPARPEPRPASTPSASPAPGLRVAAVGTGTAVAAPPAQAAGGVATREERL